MSFYHEIQKIDWPSVTAAIYAKTSLDAERALKKTHRDNDDFMALLSPAATPLLEEMARQSHAITRQRYGNVIQLYIPMYLSNYCQNRCVYCGFSGANHITRKALTIEEMQAEAAFIRQDPFRHILLVTGEAPAKAGVDYFKTAIETMKPWFSQISLEVQPLETNEYAQLVEHGLHAVYVYQETYRETAYPNYHPFGKKADYRFRLETPDRLGQAGVRKIGLGNLIGLEDWRTEAYATGMHLRYLQRQYWQTKYSIAFPRLRPFAGAGFQPNFTTTERDLTQLICAYRLFDADVELSLSTRESPRYRDNVFPLGITALSAGSKTGPGGYSGSNELEQFAVHDDRSPRQVADMLRQRGFEPVWKDWSLFLQEEMVRE
ncbi:2-iminoacetate synthase [Breznakibacter xylanolyticus]|uniref:2-iminoacetate synthase n=1 Tax=Breznakibacter xylanolyticus TaxID=990 RepID=A0A2W7NN25_9BACT|nr:2-iminoacetate synthase ThiH [Breznakibacter xylanolyticus]MBN2742758.1 2-iminoacetate synthase ThiH [Marinilabiliaceae bacterium]PZX19517.1 2-iminoacetate synthase [Breznakibacter xylanolyticus]